MMLLPFSWLYGLGAAARNSAFDMGLLPHRRGAVPVIAVGNLTAGGTGKTPLVEYITGRLVARGLNVAVVSRGYGRRSHGVVVVSRRVTFWRMRSRGGTNRCRSRGNSVRRRLWSASGGPMPLQGRWLNVGPK